MRTLLITIISLSMLSCTQENTEENKGKEVQKTEQAPTIVEDLVEINGDVFTEYYPGKKNIKFQGTQDEDNQRHGKWLYFSEEGVELSMSMFEHGKKHGHSIVKYPNGAIHYYGEYQNDKQVGVWKTYKPNGSIDSEKDYGYPAK